MLLNSLFSLPRKNGAMITLRFMPTGIRRRPIAYGSVADWIFLLLLVRDFLYVMLACDPSGSLSSAPDAFLILSKTFKIALSKALEIPFLTGVSNDMLNSFQIPI